MKLNALLLVLGFSILAAGCSDSDAQQAKQRFVAVCNQDSTLTSDEMCACAFDKLAEEYSIEELERINAMQTPPQSFLDHLGRSVDACLSSR